MITHSTLHSPPFTLSVDALTFSQFRCFILAACYRENATDIKLWFILEWEVCQDVPVIGRVPAGCGSLQPGAGHAVVVHWGPTGLQVGVVGGQQLDVLRVGESEVLDEPFREGELK